MINSFFRSSFIISILGSKLFIFLVRSWKFIHFVAPSKSSQGITLCFQLLFLSIILLLPEFFMEALHDGSSRILFILQLFFKISLKVMIHQAILKDKHGVQHTFCFEEFKHSSSCIPKCNSFFVGVILCHISPKAFPKECCIVVLINDPSFLLSSRRKQFSSLRWSQASNCFS